MEQSVSKSHLFRWQRIRQPQTWQNGAVDGSDSHFQQDPSQSGDSRRCTDRDRANMNKPILRPITVHGRTRYEVVAQHHRGGTSTSTNLYFDRENGCSTSQQCQKPRLEADAGLMSNETTLSVSGGTGDKDPKHIQNTTAAVSEKDESAGVNIDSNHEIKGKPKEAKDTVKTSSRGKKRKLRSESSKRVVDSMTEVPVSGGTGDKETKHIPNTTAVVLEKDEKAVVNINSNHEINGEPEEAKVTVKTSSRGKKRKHLRSQSHVAELTAGEMSVSDGTGDQEQKHISNTTGVLLDKDPKHIQNTTAAVSEKDESAGVNIDSNHEIKGKPKEAKDTVKTSSRGKKRKLRSESSKRVVDSMTEVPVSDGTGDKETKHIPNTTAVVLEKDEKAAVNINSNHEINGEPEEAKVTVKTSSMGKKRKHLRSQSHVAELTAREMSVSDGTGDQEQKHISNTTGVLLEKDEMSGEYIYSNHEVNGKPEEAKDTVKISSKGKKRKLLQSFSAVPEESMLCVNADNNSLQVSQPSDTATRKCQRKLLVLDVNGLLVDIVTRCPKRLKPDFQSKRRKVFKRPFCDDFLQFCFANFDVGIWSSRTKESLIKVVDFLLKEQKNKLLFCWDKTHCTPTGRNTIENNKKPLVLKELKKLWENNEKDLPWQRGVYDESNTILLDDSPYKALRNPPYTAVFPNPFSFQHVADNSLGPQGDLRSYLTRLADAENVQNFIQANPFGQRPITTAHPSWVYYAKILEGCAKKEASTRKRSGCCNSVVTQFGVRSQPRLQSFATQNGEPREHLCRG